MAEDDLEKALQETFMNATRKHSISLHMNDAEHQEYFNITQQHRTHRTHEEMAYRTEYRARVAKETKRLMQKDGSKTKDYKPDFGLDDRFNANRLSMIAERNVRGQHKIRMAGLREAERTDLDQFFDRVEQRNG